MNLDLPKSIYQRRVSYISVYMLTDYHSQILEHYFTLKRMCDVGRKINLILSSSETPWMIEHRQPVLIISVIGKPFSGSNLIPTLRSQTHNRNH